MCLCCSGTGEHLRRQGRRAPARMESSQVLEPVLSYKVMYPTDVDAVTMVSKLRLLEEEDPQLQVQWNETAGEIYIKVMGQVQLEVVAQMVRDRFGIAITYGQGRISYKETYRGSSHGCRTF